MSSQHVLEFKLQANKIQPARISDSSSEGSEQFWIEDKDGKKKQLKEPEIIDISSYEIDQQEKDFTIRSPDPGNNRHASLLQPMNV